MIVLTGGAGFIGSCFLKKLNDQSITNILVVDHLGTNDKWKNLSGKYFQKYEHKEQFRENLKEGKYNGKISSIVHFGACSKTTERDADYVMDNNYNYSIELAEYSIKHQVRYIYASSAATYGNGEYGYNDSEYAQLIPLNIYGMSKHLFDRWVIDKGYDKVFAGFKFFNVFGPNEYHKAEMSSMVFKSFNQIKETGKVRLFKSNSAEYPDGGQMRDFIYVKDIIDVIWKVFNDEAIAGIFNLGTAKAASWNDLANAVFAAMELEPKIEYVDMPQSLINQYQNYTQASMEKLNSTSAKIDFMPLEESVKDYVINYLMKNYKVF